MMKRAIAVLTVLALCLFPLAGCSLARRVLRFPPRTSKPAPTVTPVKTPRPTVKPTEKPTPKPTVKPTPEPTEAPTPEPTQEPTEAPTVPADTAAGSRSANNQEASVDEMIQYFGEVAFYWPEDAKDGYIVKWMQPIKLQIVGSPSQDQLALLDNYIKATTKLPEFPGITRVQEGGNFVMTFKPYNELLTQFPKMLTTDACYYTINWDGNCAVTNAEIGVATDFGDAAVGRTQFLRLFMLSLGVFYSSDTYYDSILNYDANPQDWAFLDWVVMSFLYSKEIQPGTSQTDALNYLRSN